MKKILFFIIVTAVWLACSCRSDQSNEKQPRNEQTELPPSLQALDENIPMVHLSEKERVDLGISTFPVDVNWVNYSVLVPGVVFPAPEHSSLVSTPINGQINRIYKFEGAMVRKGEVIFQIQSLEFGNLVSEYLQAYAEERYQRNRLNRTRQLVEETISSASELERTTSEYERASAIVRASYSKLRAIGVSENEIRDYTEGDNIIPLLNIHSPIDGIVESNFVELGQSVSALENLSRLLDIRKVLVRGYISPDDARLISPGDSVYISKRDRQSEIGATISSINPGMDENNRSVIANIIIPTVKGWPKPGENMRLKIRTSTQLQMISIPVEALTYDGNQAIVFVKKSPEIFEKRPIEVAEIRDKNVFVAAGLSDSEEIAVTKVFSLKALLRFHIISEE